MTELKVYSRAIQLSKRWLGCRKVAIAGRSKAKLEATLKDFASSASAGGAPADDKGDTARDVAILAGVDITEPGSLLAMAQSSALVLNCVGPYRFYGEPVVQACVVAGTEYLDVRGEPGACCALLMHSE